MKSFLDLGDKLLNIDGKNIFEPPVKLISIIHHWSTNWPDRRMFDLNR